MALFGIVGHGPFVALCGGGAALVPAVVAVAVAWRWRCVAVGVAEAVAVAVCGMRLKILLSFYCKLLKYMSECGIINNR